MSDDTTNGGAVEKCGATTQDGSPCKLPANSCPHHDEDNSREAEELVPSKESFTELAGFIIDETGWTGKESDSEPTQAAKAWVKAQDGGTALYRAVFGPCDEDGCSYGANGFEADSCRRHQIADDDEDGQDDEADTDISLDDLSAEQKESLLKEALSSL